MHYRTVSYWILTNFLQGILSLGALGIQTSDRMFHGPEIDVSQMVVVDYAESFVFKITQMGLGIAEQTANCR